MRRINTAIVIIAVSHFVIIVITMLFYICSYNSSKTVKYCVKKATASLDSVIQVTPQSPGHI